MKVPKIRHITAKANQKTYMPAPSSVKYVIILCGIWVYVRTTLRKVAVAIIANITAVIDAVSFKQAIKPEIVSSL